LLHERPVRLEAVLHPPGAVAGGDRERTSVDGRLETGHVGHVEVGHPRQLLHRHAVGRDDVGLALALCGDAHGELAGAVPRSSALLPQESGDVAEEGHALERVAAEWTVRSHRGIVGGWQRVPTAGSRTPPPLPRWWSLAQRASSVAAP